MDSTIGNIKDTVGGAIGNNEMQVRALPSRGAKPLCAVGHSALACSCKAILVWHFMLCKAARSRPLLSAKHLMLLILLLLILLCKATPLSIFLSAPPQAKGKAQHASGASLVPPYSLCPSGASDSRPHKFEWSPPALTPTLCLSTRDPCLTGCICYCLCQQVVIFTVKPSYWMQSSKVRLLCAGESETTAAKAQGYADGVGDSIMGKAKVCRRSSPCARRIRPHWGRHKLGADSV
jgi:hypothetical protein